MKSSHTQSLGRVLTEPDVLKSYLQSEYFAGILIDEQLGPFLLRNDLQDLLLPKQVSLIQSQIMINELFLQQLKTVEEAFKRENIFFCRLKGAAQLIHLNVQDRVMKDLDLLVPRPEDFERAERILLDLGYKKTEQTRWEAADNRFDYYLEISGVEVHVDLHSQLFWEASRSSKLNIIEKDGSFVLAPEDQAFHLLANWLYQDGGYGVYKIWDLQSLLTPSPEFSWNRLKDLARAQKIEHVVAVGLAILDTLFETNWTARWGTSIRISRFAKRIVESDFLLHPRQQPLRYFFFKHWVRSTWSQALYFDYLWVKAYWRPWLRIFSSRAWFVIQRLGYSKPGPDEQSGTLPE